MNASDLMTKNPVCCNQHRTLEEAARLMTLGDCGVLPIVNDQSFLIGIITDRDICTRAVANGFSPDALVQQFMSTPVLTVRDETPVEEICELMSRHDIRRLIVADAAGRCHGVISQSDLARKADGDYACDVLKKLSDLHESRAYLR